MIDSKLNGVVRQLDNGHFSLTFSRTLRTSIYSVWNALACEKEREGWFQGLCFVNKKDGSIRLDFGDEGKATGKIISINRPSELVHTLVWEYIPTSEVGWSFARIDNENTMVVVTHQNLTSGLLVDWAVGWHVVLDDLVAYAEHKRTPLPDFEMLGSYYSKQLVV